VQLETRNAGKEERQGTKQM